MNPRGSTSRLRVLVVDDDPLVRKLLRTTLSDEGFDLQEAADGLEALKLASETVPDVVLLDVMMPGLNGYDVCRTLRADPRMSKSRIVLLTARHSPQDREEGERAGADHFFTKPFSPLDLIEAVVSVRDGAA